MQLRNSAGNACMSGNRSEHRAKHQGWLELRMHDRSAMRSRRWVQHEHQFLLFLAPHQSCRALGWCEPIYLGTYEVRESAAARWMGRILPGSGVGDVAEHHDSLRSMVERRNLRAHRVRGGRNP